jgi:transketolase
MIDSAAGLASSGKIPFAASFSCFALNKGFEQLRVTVALPNVNVKVVGAHSAISIGEDGPSQMSIEDLGLACSLPGFTVLSPADEVAMMRALVYAAAGHAGPVFIRAGARRLLSFMRPINSSRLASRSSYINRRQGSHYHRSWLRRFARRRRWSQRASPPG